MNIPVNMHNNCTSEAINMFLALRRFKSSEPTGIRAKEALNTRPCLHMVASESDK